MPLHNFGIEEVVELFGGHATTCIFDGNLYVVGILRLRCTDRYSPTLFCELSGIIGQRVEHEEGEHLIGLDNGIGRRHVEGDTLHLERGAPLGDEVEELLQGETLNMQTELALAQLDPVGEHIVVVVNLISQLANVSGIGLLGRFHLVEDAIDERGDAINER